MKKEIIGIVLLSVLFVSMPLVSAQTYSGFSRFFDNVKLFFSGGDNKVQLALEIKEKEVNSALENAKLLNNEKAEKNLEQAWKKLQLIQEKATINTAEKIKQSSDEIIKNIKTKNLTKDFEVYVLEEEKTGLTAEWVIEVNRRIGQTMETEVIGEANSNQTRIEKRIEEIDNEIANWVVENSVGKEGEGDNGLTWEVKNEIAQGDNGLKPEVKTYMEIVKQNVIDKASMTKDNEDVSPAPNIFDEGMCKEGEEDCKNDDMAPGPQGIVGKEEHESHDNEEGTTVEDGDTISP